MVSVSALGIVFLIDAANLGIYHLLAQIATSGAAIAHNAVVGFLNAAVGVHRDRAASLIPMPDVDVAQCCADLLRMHRSYAGIWVMA